MILSDRKLMEDEIRIFLKKKHHYIINDLSDSKIQLLWDILNGRARNGRKKQ